MRIPRPHENPTTNDDFYEEAESGVGTFSISMTELNIATTYYVRAYAVTSNGTVYGDQKTFTTRDGIPTLTTAEITNLTCESVTCGGEITDNGGLNVTARGVCWSTSPNPTLSDSYTTDDTGVGSFTSSIADLDVSTTYYVRAYATTNVCTSYGNEVSFTTPSGIPEVVTNPVTNIYGDGATMGCTVVDDGGFVVDQENGWCYLGVCWSNSPNPTTNDYKAYIENGGWAYQPISNDFSAYRTGLSLSTTYYVRAYAQTRFGTSYGNEVSFTTPAPLWSNGVLPGEFSVNEGQQVRFSQGNLQYRASTDTWRFALNQWSFVGGTQVISDDPQLLYIAEVYGNVYTESGAKCDNASFSSSGWIDLFGWGTSGNNHGAYCYQPWSTSENVSDYYAYGNSSNNLYDQTGQADWGSNAISNGGNQTNQWRTLTSDEWTYLFNTRSTASGIRYAKAIVFDTKGVILLPDDWDPSYYPLNNTNNSGASFSSNTITTEQWSILEQHGAVFLCETGRRHRYSISYPGSGEEPDYEQEEYGFYSGGAYYWSSSYKNTSYAWLLSIKDSGLNPKGYALRHKGMAVRLVCSTSLCESPTVTTTEVANITHCQATCGGIVTDDGGYESTVRGICWSTTPNPTVANAHTIDGNGIGSFTSTMTGLMPNTTYYARAYATNLLYTAYGSEESFTTSESPEFCTISVSANPTDGGTVNGEGTCAYGQSYSVHAMPNTGFYFANWTENGSVVSTDANYTFTVTDSRNLVANFTAYPTGAINGQFSVNETLQVLFSQGNLQYQASTNTWKFADNQFDYIGSDNNNISSSYSGWIDLFGWGTSGYNHGANCYQPWSTSTSYSDYYAYGCYFLNLCDQTGQADWGYNPISNDGNQENQWRTLTNQEWQYLFYTRTTTSGIRYAKAKVNDVNGVILLPDDWSSETYSLSNTNSTGASFSNNTISASQWNTLEQAGAVFLPAAGRRNGTSVGSMGSDGYYWSATCNVRIHHPYSIFFSDWQLYISSFSTSQSVRLVRDFE